MNEELVICRNCKTCQKEKCPHINLHEDNGYCNDIVCHLLLDKAKNIYRITHVSCRIATNTEIVLSRMTGEELE